MNSNLKIFSFVIASIVFFSLTGCENKPETNQKPPASAVVSGTIKMPPAVSTTEKKAIIEKKEDSQVVESGIQQMTTLDESNIVIESEKLEHYDSKGKLDPFKPLIQEETDLSDNITEKRSQRILTPLEKIDISQIRLVAVIIMDKKQIAMVEEASGKGYEVGLGTYIGKNQGKVTEIKDSSIVITELTRDYKGRLKEQIQEIKLHKNDNGE